MTRFPKTKLFLAMLVVVGIVTMTKLWPVMREQRNQKMLAKAKAAYNAKRLEECMSLCEVLMERAPALLETRILAGRAAWEEGDADRALGYLEPMLAKKYRDAVALVAWGANLDFQNGRLEDAEKRLSQAVELDPLNSFARQRLVDLLSMEGRWWEALPHRYHLLMQGAYEMYDLLFLGNPQAMLIDEDLQQMIRKAPDHPLLLLGQARFMARNNQTQEAEQILRDVVAQRPDINEAHAELGLLLVDAADDESLQQWNAALPSTADEHPDIWVARGLWAQRRGETSQAVRCFWEAARIDPNHQLAHYQLSINLAATGDDATAKKFQQRAELLSELLILMDDLSGDPTAVPSMRRAAEICESLGRLWEARAWRGILVETDKNNASAAEDELRVRKLLTDDLPPVRPGENVAAQVELSNYPLPDFRPLASDPVQQRNAQSRARFQDVAAASKLDFQYYDVHDPKQEGRYMYEWTGGGVAVLDFDGDQWPDVYLTQACPFPPGSQTHSYRNQLFRNLGNGEFQDVTDQAGVGDQGYGQGVAVGDFDNDGWPDIFVANIGNNTLYHNNGDGTFSDVTVPAGISDERWTTSCAIADLNGDALPDIYEVNYLQGADIYRRKCTTEDRPRVCSPTFFDGQHDRLWINLGDGRFEERAQQLGLQDGAPGKGLGIVIGDLLGTGSNAIYLANDMTANSLYVLNPSSNGPRFSDQGVIAGVAFGRDGAALAGMGIAADDLNNDGWLDLFVTNFHRETNSLYFQQSSGTFLDLSSQAGISAVSYDLLGFGTQCVDAELDGLPDLVITNGHLDDFRFNGVPFKMKPQFLHNLGGQVFRTVAASQLGPYFDSEMLGRGMAKIDWNRDGREDILITHLDRPVALLENQTPEAGHFLIVRLRGRTVERDAVGATVTVQCGPKKYAKWLLAGDGYQSSNQRQLVFGLGEATTVDQLEVHWPNGHKQALHDIAADQTISIVENRN